MREELYEDDEPAEKVLAAFDAGTKQVTTPPSGGGKHLGPWVAARGR